MRTTFAALTSTLLLSCAINISAQTAAPAKAALCGACHGDASGSRISNTPSLAGQPRVFLENTLVLIRDGQRDIPAMKGMLDGVQDEELIELSKYYAAMTLKDPGGKRDDKLYARGKEVSDQTRCATCHLSDFSGREQMPRLAFQRQDYLLQSLRDFRANKAVGRDSNMAAALHGISDTDFQALAHYLSIGPNIGSNIAPK